MFGWMMKKEDEMVVNCRGVVIWLVMIGVIVIVIFLSSLVWVLNKIVMVNVLVIIFVVLFCVINGNNIINVDFGDIVLILNIDGV